VSDTYKLISSHLTSFKVSSSSPKGKVYKVDIITEKKLCLLRGEINSRKGKTICYDNEFLYYLRRI
jgi:hypothetical protein